MKKNLMLACLNIMIILAFTSCEKEDDDKPKPNQPAVISPADFIHNRNIIERGEEVRFMFRGNKTKISSLDWDFGNGQKSTDSIATIRFDDLGSYTITLTVKDSLNQIYTMNSTVKVGKRYLTGFIFKEIGFNGPGGNSWDTTDGPDLILRFGRYPFNYSKEYKIADNVTPAMLPLAFTVQDTFSLDSYYMAQLSDFDRGTAIVYEPIITFSNASAYPAMKDYQTGKGTLIAVQGSEPSGTYRIDFTFQVQ